MHTLLMLLLLLLISRIIFKIIYNFLKNISNYTKRALFSVRVKIRSVLKVLRVTIYIHHFPAAITIVYSLSWIKVYTPFSRTMQIDRAMDEVSPPIRKTLPHQARKGAGVISDNESQQTACEFVY